jgi:hypothetical protein
MVMLVPTSKEFRKIFSFDFEITKDPSYICGPIWIGG